MGKRILSRRRGAAQPRLTSPSHRHKGDVRYPNKQGEAEVVKLLHAPGRTAILTELKFEDGTKTLQIAAEGLALGQTVTFTDTTQIRPGNITIVSKIPEGTPIFNVEGRPGDGGQFCKSAGNSAEIVSHDAKRTVIRLPSGKFRNFHPNCRATVGLVAGGGRGDKPFLKAGKKFHLMKNKAQRWPRVRGVAMNPVDHPHGGGAHNYTPGKTSVARGTPPGRKVGKIAPKRTGKR
ncbi:MAG: 50S ribosomal protein L2 [Thermoplasmatota archaeon]